MYVFFQVLYSIDVTYCIFGCPPTIFVKGNILNYITSVKTEIKSKSESLRASGQAGAIPGEGLQPTLPVRAKQVNLLCRTARRKTSRAKLTRDARLGLAGSGQKQ